MTASEYNISECGGRVIVGRDTRISSPALAAAVLEGVAAVGGAAATDIGVVTTPQLHYMVVAVNTEVGGGMDGLIACLLA